MIFPDILDPDDFVISACSPKKFWVTDLTTCIVKPPSLKSEISSASKRQGIKPFLGLAAETRWLTNGHYAVLMPPEDHEEVVRAAGVYDKESVDRFNLRVQPVVHSAVGRPARVVAVRGGYTPLYLVSDSGRRVAVDAQYCAAILCRYPASQIYIATTPAKTAIFRDGHKPVGMIAPIENVSTNSMVERLPRLSDRLKAGPFQAVFTPATRRNGGSCVVIYADGLQSSFRIEIGSEGYFVECRWAGGRKLWADGLTLSQAKQRAKEIVSHVQREIACGKLVFEFQPCT